MATPAATPDLRARRSPRTTAKAAPLRTRRNVWSLPAGDQTLLWYGRAVAAMQQKPIADPSSWRYQAAIHEYVQAGDPLSTPGDVLPSTTDRLTFWTQCQHGSWFFLPWHRMYLHHFERIVAAEVVKLGGPADWALPYWNYSADAASRLLPPAFRSPTLPDGSPNPLHVAERDPRCERGEQFADAQDVALDCLTEADFGAPAVGGGSSFGGPATKFEHSGGAIGALEGTPHGTMHVAVGGGGWMSRFNTAALDPIFWLHHANIDRLWAVWLARDPQHADPKVKAWRTGVAFKFHDVSGKVVRMTPKQVVDTKAPPLSYVYDDVGDPLAAVTPARVAAAARGGTAVMAKRTPPEMVGATTTGIEIGAGPAHAELRVHAAGRSRTALTARGGGRPRRVFLNVENIVSDTPAGAYDVYVNVPAGTDPHTRPDLRAGRLSLFGLRETSRAGTTHAGSGLQYNLDVTDLVGRLAAEPGWDPATLRVSFVPKEEGPPAKVRVGRVSLHVE